MVYLDLSERENKYWTTSYKGLQQGLNFMGEEGSGVCAGATPALHGMPQQQLMSLCCFPAMSLALVPEILQQC